MPTLRTWLQLLRAPNLFTVPGDPIVGYLIANSGAVDSSLAPVVLASLCLYGAGLLQNDVADEAEDRRERPARPLPSGEAARAAVIVVMSALALAGVALAWWAAGARGAVIAAALAGSVTLYNQVTKRWAVFGALNMGTCRSLSVLLGAVAGPLPFPVLAIPFVVLFGLYIAAVTNLARHETRAQIPVLARGLPALVVVLIAVSSTAFAVQSPARTPVVFLYLGLVAWVLWLAVKMFRRPAAPLPPLIGAHIRVLLPLQAAACYLADPWEAGRIAAIVLLALWPLSHFTARRFYAS